MVNWTIQPSLGVLSKHIQNTPSFNSLMKEKDMRTLAALGFPSFKTLDYFGPIAMFGGFGKETEIIPVAKTRDPVPGVQGQRIMVDNALSEKMTMICYSFAGAIQHWLRPKIKK